MFTWKKAGETFVAFLLASAFLIVLFVPSRDVPLLGALLLGSVISALMVPPVLLAVACLQRWRWRDDGDDEGGMG